MKVSSLLATSLLATLTAFAAPKPYLLRLRVKPGQVYRYEIRMKNGSGAQTSNNVTQIEMKVATVIKDKISVASRVTSLTQNGKPVTGTMLANVQKLKPINLMNDRGETLGVIVNGKQTKGSGGGISGAGFPTRAVQPGDSWQSPVATVDGKTTKATVKFVRVENFQGKPAAYLIASVPQAKGVTASPTKMWVDLDTGMLFKLEMSATMKQGSVTGQMSIVMTRI